jgi:hypothetical protein
MAKHDLRIEYNIRGCCRRAPEGAYALVLCRHKTAEYTYSPSEIYSAEMPFSVGSGWRGRKIAARGRGRRNSAHRAGRYGRRGTGRTLTYCGQTISENVLTIKTTFLYPLYTLS